MRESSFLHALKLGLKKASNNKIFLQRHEDKCALGIPDLSYCYEGYSGWIEAKSIADYPKRKSTFITIPHFTLLQQYWLESYCIAGGDAWLLLHIKKDTYLIAGTRLRLLKNLTKEKLALVSNAHWLNKLPYDKLLSLLSKDHSEQEEAAKIRAIYDKKIGKQLEYNKGI